MCDSGNKLQKVVDGYQNYENKTGALDSEFGQTGGGVGYLLDLENPRVGGKAEVLGYESAPEFKDGALVDQRSETGMLMGQPNQCGGAKKKLSGKKHNNNNYAKMNNNKNNNNNNNNKVRAVKVNHQVKKSKKKSRGRYYKGRRYSKKKGRYMAGKKTRGKGKYSHKKRSHRGKYHRKNKSKNRKRFSKAGKKMKGGDGCQHTRLDDGKPSVYTDDMSQRTFDAKQPNWEPSAI